MRAAMKVRAQKKRTKLFPSTDTRLLYPEDHQSYGGCGYRGSGQPSENIERPGIHPSPHDPPVVGHSHQQQHEERRRKTLHDSGPYQGFDGIQTEKIHAHRDSSDNDYRRVEGAGLPCRGIKAMPQTERLTKIVCGSSGHYRNGNEADTNYSKREQEFGELSRQRLQCLRRFGRRVDVKFAGTE